MKSHVMRKWKVSAIKIVERGPVDEERVQAYMESMSTVGQLAPIGVTKKGRLVFGRHRLEAARKLGWDEIDVVVLELDDLGLELATIDENLIRVQPPTLVRGEQLVRRKAIYEELHPETRQHVAGGKGRHRVATDNSSVAESFAEEVAARLGESAHNVRRDVRLATLICPEARDILRTTDVAKNRRALERIAGLPEGEQVAVAEAISSGRVQTVAQALAVLQPAETADPGVSLDNPSGLGILPTLQNILSLAVIAEERCHQSPQEQVAVCQEIGDLADRLEALESSGELFELDADEFEDLGMRVIRVVRDAFWAGKQRLRS